MLELRAHVKRALGKDLNLKALNDFNIAQVLLSPDQLQEAVETEFLPHPK